MMSVDHIELRKLEHVSVLARVGNYQRAADELGLTQPALTRSIQALEKRLSVRLFDRGRGGVRPTPVGHVLVERAEAMLREASDLARHLKRVAEGEAGEVAFGMSPLAAKAVLADLLSDQLRLRPDIQAMVAVRSADALLPLLLAERIDFFVASLGSIAPDAVVEAMPLGAAPSTLLVRAGHALVGRGRITPADSEAFPLIISTQPGAQFAGRARMRHPSVVTDDYETLLALTRDNDAIWMASSIAYRAELARGELVALEGIVGLDLPDTQLAAFRLARVTLSPLAETMLGEIRRRIGELCGAHTPSH